MDYKWLEFKASTLNNGAVKEEPIHEKPMSKETDISSDQALSGLADYNSTHVNKFSTVINVSVAVFPSKWSYFWLYKYLQFLHKLL